MKLTHSNKAVAYLSVGHKTKSLEINKTIYDSQVYYHMYVIVFHMTFPIHQETY